jgi:hypothetical protein
MFDFGPPILKSNILAILFCFCFFFHFWSHTPYVNYFLQDVEFRFFFWGDVNFIFKVVDDNGDQVMNLVLGLVLA